MNHIQVRKSDNTYSLQLGQRRLEANLFDLTKVLVCARVRCTPKTYKFGPEVPDARGAKERHARTDLPLEYLDEAKDTRFAIGLHSATVRGRIIRKGEAGLTLWAYRTGRPSPTARAPRQTHLRTSAQVTPRQAQRLVM